MLTLVLLFNKPIKWCTFCWSAMITPSTPECIEAYFEPLVRLSLSVWSIFCHSTSHAKSSIMNYYCYLLWAGMIPCLLQCNHLENDWPTTSSLLTYLIFFEVTFQKYYLGTYYIVNIESTEFQLFLFTFSGRCENGNPCAQNCYNIHNEMYECECHHGFVLSDNGYSCIGKHVLWF